MKFRDLLIHVGDDVMIAIEAARLRRNVRVAELTMVPVAARGLLSTARSSPIRAAGLVMTRMTFGAVYRELKRQQQRDSRQKGRGKS